MQYRKMNKHNIDVSLYGLGCMRLPTVEVDGKNKIDRPHAISMIRYAIDHGCNYIDTAYPYHGGESELVVGEALRDGYRNKTYLASKLPIWMLKDPEDFDKYLNEQLAKLQTDHIDFYLMHGLDIDSWPKAKGLGVLDYMKRAKEDGRIRNIGFSFHDEYSVFKEIIDSFDWDMCQIQFNLLDEHIQATVDGLRYAGEKNVPVVIMEPLKGGRLTNSVPSYVQQIWDNAPIKRAPLEWAFRWLYNFPEISVILSGASSMTQLQQALACFDQPLAPGCMSAEEFAITTAVQQAYASRIKVGCTGCQYCVPCPNKVNIPSVFALYNDAFIYESLEDCKVQYAKLLAKGEGVPNCIECGICEGLCPQHLSIIKMLKEAHEALK